MGAGSTSRIRRPMYCNWRLSAPNLVMRLYSSIASSRFSSRFSSRSFSFDSVVSVLPRSCSSSICFLILVLLGGSSSCGSSWWCWRVFMGTVRFSGCCYDSASRRTSRPNFMHTKVSKAAHTADSLQQLASDIVAYARKQGASACATDVSEGFGQTVSVRHGAVETIEYNRDKGMSVSVYLGKRRGHASTSDFSKQAVRDTVDAALNIARYTAEDDCAGLPDADRLATEFPDLDLYHPWALEVEQAIALARDCEQAALDADSRISNSEGATVNVHEGQFIHANSLGFVGGYPSSRHSVSCSVIAGKDEAMERDYWYSLARDAREILRVEEIGRIAAERTVRRLKARKLDTTQCPVLFEAPVAASLLGHFVGAVSGGSLYRKSSFLLDQLERPVFSEQVRIDDVPDIPRGLA